MKKGDIEFRWSEFNKRYELVRWNGRGTCCTVAFFEKHKEGYYLSTVSDRFFEDHDAWIVGKHSLNFLNAIFHEKTYEEEQL